MKKADINEIKEYLFDIFEQERINGKDSIILRSGDIHDALEYKNRQASVCNAMHRVAETNFIKKYEIIEQPKEGKGSNLYIKYYL